MESTDIKTPALGGIKELFRDSWAMYRARFGDLFRINLPPFVVGLLSLSLISLSAGWAVFAGVLLSLLSGILGMYAVLAGLKTLRDGSSLEDSYSFTRGRFLAYAWVLLLNACIVAGGVMLLVVPAIIFGFWSYLSNYVFAYEDRRGLEAFLQSKEYVRGHTWALLGRLILVGLGAGLATGLVRTLFGDQGLGEFLAFVLQFFIGMFLLVYGYQLYLRFERLRPELKAVRPQVRDRRFFAGVGILGILGPILILIGVVIFLARTAQAAEPQALGVDAQATAPYLQSVSEWSRDLNGFFGGFVKLALEQGAQSLPSVAGGAIKMIGTARNGVGDLNLAQYVPQAEQALSDPAAASRTWLSAILTDIRQTFWVILDRTRALFGKFTGLLGRSG